MKTRGFVLLWSIAVLFIYLSSADAFRTSSLVGQSAGEAKRFKILRRIYEEVKELGPYPGEDFIKREFFIGNEDDDDTNKNQHVAVLIQNVNGRETVRLQVTYMAPAKENPQVKWAKDMKSVLGQVVGNKILIISSDYDDRELDKITAEILRAIQNKKKLLKL
jgi:hypothetical protein